MVARRGRRRPAGPTAELPIGAIARYDTGRLLRTGVPEIVLAEGKSFDHLLELLQGLRDAGRGALISRPTAVQRRGLERAARAGLPVTPIADGRLYRLAGPLGRPRRRGTVALLTAGTADVPIALESAAVLEAYGVAVLRRFDVGVAGIHRLQRALAGLERKRPRLYLVFAGREGALPTVVAGLVRAPVVGVPTSVGYGHGGRGTAALQAMLQSCAPIAVVNIDGGVPAALFALQLLEGDR